MIQAEAIVYEFSRPKVERGDFSGLLEQFAFDRLPTDRRLRVMMNSMVFCIHGWDYDPREIHCIPEIRAFYRAFREAWPYWLYFCNLDVDTLRASNRSRENRDGRSDECAQSQGRVTEVNPEGSCTGAGRQEESRIKEGAGSPLK